MNEDAHIEADLEDAGDFAVRRLIVPPPNILVSPLIVPPLVSIVLGRMLEAYDSLR